MGEIVHLYDYLNELHRRHALAVAMRTPMPFQPYKAHAKYVIYWQELEQKMLDNGLCPKCEQWVPRFHRLRWRSNDE